MMAIGLLLVAAAETSMAAGGGADRQTIMPEDSRAREFLERYGFSEAVIDGDHVYLSGVVAGTPHDGGDPKAAYDRAFRMIADVLKRSGSSWDSVIDMITFHTDLPAQIEGFTEVKNLYVRAPFPAWTAIDVDRLLPDNGLVEIKIVAKRSPDAGKARK